MMNTIETNTQRMMKRHRRNMFRWASCGLWMALLAMMLTACISEPTAPAGEGTRVRVGDAWPRFEVQLSDGTPFSSDSLRGRTAMVVFFHTGCPDCRTLLPRVDSLYRTLSADVDFRLVCIARAEGPASIQRFWKQEHLTMPVSPQTSAQVYQLFAYTRVPRIYMSSPQGIVRFVHDDRALPTLKQLLEEVTFCRKEVADEKSGLVAINPALKLCR